MNTKRIHWATSTFILNKTLYIFKRREAYKIDLSKMKMNKISSIERKTLLEALKVGGKC